MKPKTLLVLAALVAALASFVWFYERKLPSSEERAAQSKKVLTLKSADVESVLRASAHESRGSAVNRALFHVEWSTPSFVQRGKVFCLPKSQRPVL